MSMTVSETPAAFDRPVSTIPRLIELYGRWQPDRTALICDGRRVTWGQYASEANRVANGLIGLGIAPGDRVAMLTGNSIETLQVMAGILAAGAVLVPLSTMLDIPTLRLMLKDSGAKVLFSEDPYTEAFPPEVRADAAVIDGGWIVFDGGSGGEWRPFDDWIAGFGDRPPGVGIRGEDDFNIIYSSGTTGTPKGITHGHAARFSFALTRAVDFRVDSDSVMLVTTPLYHNGSCLLVYPAWLVGATIVIMPKFDPVAWMDLVERERCSHTFMVPAQYQRLSEVPDLEYRDLSSLRMALTAGAAIPADIKQVMLTRIGDAFMELYGATEGFSTTIRASEMTEKPDSVGRPVIGVDVRLLDDDGNEVAPGEVGEIAGNSPYLFREYHNQPQLTAAAIWLSPAGETYFRSGDLGRIDEQGYLYVVGRKKDMIISGGINIYAGDLEQLLSRHADVVEAAVIGVPHREWGETPVAYVMVRKDAVPDAGEVLNWANERLAKFQRLSRVLLRPDLPRNSMGKVLKVELMRDYERERGDYE